MRRPFLVGLLLLLAALPVAAQVIPSGTTNPCGGGPGQTGVLTTAGYQSLQIGRAAAVGLTKPGTSALPRGEIWMVVGTTATAPSATYGTNYRDDGTNPTATLGTGGMTITGQTIIICQPQITAIKFIGNGTSDTVWAFTYYGF